MSYILRELAVFFGVFATIALAGVLIAYAWPLALLLAAGLIFAFVAMCRRAGGAA